MTNSRFPKDALAIALLAALAVGCSSEKAAEHGAEEGHVAPQSSSAGLPSGHVAAGEQLASTKGAATGQSCVDCHGAEGNAPIDDSYPRLAGQYPDYITHALQAYRDGHREHALMSSQAKALTDQQIADLGAYFSSRQGQLRDLSKR